MSHTAAICDVENQTFNWRFCERHAWQMYPPPPNRVFRHWPIVGGLETKASKRLGNHWRMMAANWDRWSIARRQEAVERIDALIAGASR